MVGPWYVSPTGTGANGTSWATAATSFVDLLTTIGLVVAGDIIYVDSTLADSYSSATTLTFPGTNASPNLIYCVAVNTTSPVTTGASVSTTLGNALNVNGALYCQGIIFSAGSGANNATLSLNNTSGIMQRYDNCSFRTGGTVGSVHVAVNQFSFTDLNNCTLQAGSTGIQCVFNGKCRWRNTPSAITGANIPTQLFAANSSGPIIIENVDLSAITGTIIGSLNANGQDYFFKDCKFASGVAFGTPSGLNCGRVIVSNCGNASGEGYQFAIYDYAGTEKHSTSVTRTGGASTGTQQFSKQIVTTTHSQWAFPFDTYPMSIWNTSTTSQTLNIYGVWDAPGANTPPNNNDIWIEVNYPTDAGDPLGAVATSGIATALTSPAAYSTDSSTWAGTSGFTHATPFIIPVTFTAAQAGLITVKVKAAKVSITFYIDPLA